MANYTIHHIVHGSLGTLIENQEDLLRQILNSGLRRNVDDIPLYFKTLIELFKRFDIQTEIENIEEWTSFAKLPIESKQVYTCLSFPVYTNKTAEFFNILLKNTLVAQFQILNKKLSEIDNITDRTYKLYQTVLPFEPLLKDIVSKSYTTINTKYVKDLICISLFNFYFEVLRFNVECNEFETISPDEALFIIDNNYIQNRTQTDSIINILSTYIENRSKTIEVINETKEEVKPIFKVQKCDFRDNYAGKFDYESIDKKELFERVEMHLFEYEYIDADYNFKKVHGKKKHLAMVYKILIQKGFFKKKNIKHKTKDFEPSEYRQYLDHRYGVNTSQEFSRCTPKAINDFKSKMYFLNSL